MPKDYSLPSPDTETREGVKSDRDLMDIMDDWLFQAYSYLTEKVVQERAKALDYYNSKPYANEVEGRSKFRAPEVLTTVEWIKPSLIRIFTGGEETITIAGRGDEDTDKAKATQAWVNYVINIMNPGFMMYYTWFTDGLLQKTGFVKSYWATRTEVVKERLTGISEQAYRFLEAVEAENDDREILHAVERDATPEEMATIAQQALAQGLEPPAELQRVYDVEASRKVEENDLVIDCCPPEEVLFLPDTRDTGPRGGRFWCHRVQKPLSEIREMGYDVPDDVSSDPLISEGSDDREVLARGYSDTSEWGVTPDREIPSMDPAVRMVWFYECHMLVDDDGDGIAEWIKIHRVANKILSREQVRRVNLSYLTPIPMPHRLVGKSMADLVIPLEDLKTTILRRIMDYLYFTTNPRAEIVEAGMNQFTLSDWLNNQPNQPIRVKQKGTVSPFFPPQIPSAVFTMLEWVDQDKESRTGISRFNQGLSPDTLNKTATGIVSLINQAVQRIELIARVFAETGVRDLVMHILELSADYPEQVGQRMFRLSNGQTYQITPDDILRQYDLIINVGAGAADKGQTMQHVMTLLQTMQQLIAGGAGPTSATAMIRWENLYNAMKELIHAMGLKNPGDFVTDPESPEFNQEVQPPPNPEMEKLKLEAQKIQGEQQLKQIELQGEQRLKQQELQLKERELVLKSRELDLQAKELEIAAAKTGSDISAAAVDSVAKLKAAGEKTSDRRNSKSARS